MAARSNPSQPVAAVSCNLLFVRLARASRSSLTDALAETGLRPHEFALLHELAESGPSSQLTLGRALRIDPGNLVGLLDGLESKGLLARKRDPADRRRHLVQLTPAGQRQLDRAHQAAVEAERELLGPLGAAERRQLHAILTRLTAHSCGRKC